MEVITRRPASPPSLPRGEFRFDDSAYATAPCSPHRRLPSLTAPPSPDPFDLLPPPSSTPRLAGANPFDLFQHFTSAPASPRRAAAIYAHFADANRDDGAQEHEKDDDEEEEEFQHRSSYSTAASAVPFDWEETPGTPKAGIGIGMGGAAPAWDDDDDTGDFEFGTVVDKAAPAESRTATADELFEKGKIRPLKPLLKTSSELSDKGGSGKMRPLKPPPGLLDGGTSVGSSPRSPMAVLRSPRRRSRVGSGTDFDPFAAALLEASKAAPAPSPSPLGTTTKEANGMMKPKTMTASKSAGWRRWRLSDLLLFRSSSEGGRINNNRDSVFRCSPGKANGKVGSVDDKPKMKQGGAAVAEGVVGCARLSPLQRLARGLGGGHSWHHGRGMAATGTKG